MLRAVEGLERVEMSQDRPKTVQRRTPWPVGGAKPPVQGQLDVQGSLKPPVQCQLDVQGSPETSFFLRFSCFFEAAARELGDSQRGGPKLCFCWQAQYFRGFAHLPEKPEIDENRCPDAPATLRGRGRANDT